MSEEIRLLVADDDEIIRLGLASLLNSRDGLRVVAAVANGAEALRVLELQKVDVALIDVDMPGIDGIQAAKRIGEKYPNIAIVMLTAFEHEESLAKSISAGVRGFLTKDIPVDELAMLIKKAHSGQTVMGPKPTQMLTSAYANANSNKEAYADFIDAVHSLPAHLCPTFKLLLQAKTNKEIAKQLHLTPATVRSYVSDILSHTGCLSRGKLAIVAIKAGFE